MSSKIMIIRKRKRETDNMINNIVNNIINNINKKDQGGE